MYLSKVTKLIGGQFQVRICVWLNLKPEACRKYILLVVQLLSHVRIFVTPWTAARQALLSFTISWSMLKLMSIESVMPSNHFILCRPLLLLPLIFPSSRVFSNESVLHIRWPKYWSFSLSISPSNDKGSYWRIFRWIKSVLSCVWLCDPKDHSPPGSSVHGISQARILEWIAISSSRGSSWSRDQTWVSWVSCIGRQVLYQLCHLRSLQGDTSREM